MAKKIHKKNKNKKTKFNKDESCIYFGLCLFLFSIFLLIFKSWKSVGILGTIIKSFLKGSFGIIGSFFPWYILFLSICFIFASLRKNIKKILISTFIIFLAFLILMDILHVEFSDFSTHLNNAISEAKIHRGGGILGSFLSHLVRLIFGNFGGYFVVLLMWIFSLFSLFNVKKKDIISGTQQYTTNIEKKISYKYDQVKSRRAFKNPFSDTKDVKIAKNNDIKIVNDAKNEFNSQEFSEEETNNDYNNILNIDENNDLDNFDYFEPEIEKGDVNDQMSYSYEYNKNIENEYDDCILIEDKNVDEDKSIIENNDNYDYKNFDDNVIEENYTIQKNMEKEDENFEYIYDDNESIVEEKKEYVFPISELLNSSPKKAQFKSEKLLKNAEIITSTLASFGIEATVEHINRGPTITCYELKPAVGVKISKITNLHDNISMALATKDIRIVAPIPGKARVGIETPNDEKEILYLRDIIESEEFRSFKDNLPIILGKDITGKIIIGSISDMPHLLIAGATGSGKSVCINTLILSIIYKSSPEDVKFIMIDPKVVELSMYNSLPHMLIPVVTDAKKASQALDWAVAEMERRYSLFAKYSVKDFKSFNNKHKEINEPKMKKIVIIIDELADLMLVSGKEVEESISRLAQMARAAGIHMVVATQRPSVDVITGTIKANIPSRISFSVSSQIDSRTILDMTGAEKLLGKGDMLYLPYNQSSPTRIQGPFVTDVEIERIIDFIKNNNSDVTFSKDMIEKINNPKESSNVEEFDELLRDAVILVVRDNQGSISYLQRKLKVGYSRAARMIDQMEDLGIVGPNEGSKPRKVLIGIDEVDSKLGLVNEN